MKEIILKESEIDKGEYFIVEYYLESETTLEKAALEVAIGQSFGNPNARAANWENPDLIEKYCAKVVNDGNLTDRIGLVRIAYPTINLNWKEDGLPQLLAIIQGGQLDIKNIQVCHVKNILFPQSIMSYFKSPKFGLTGLRTKTNCYNRPLLLGICKPKLMDSPKMLLEMIVQMVEGGINLIKLDEINSSPPSCKVEDRMWMISDYLKDKNVVYFDCVTSEWPYLERRARMAAKYQLGVHINHWVGWGTYRSIRNLDLDLPLFCQRSGDKCVTERDHKFHIDWSVMCKLLGLSGIDVCHSGMFFGYSNDCPTETKKAMKVLRSFDIAPTLSCGFSPDLVEKVTNEVGNVDYIIGAGGSIHSHTEGTTKGVAEFRRVIDNLYGW